MKMSAYSDMDHITLNHDHEISSLLRDRFSNAQIIQRPVYIFLCGKKSTSTHQLLNSIWGTPNIITNHVYFQIISHVLVDLETG